VPQSALRPQDIQSLLFIDNTWARREGYSESKGISGSAGQYDSCLLLFIPCNHTKILMTVRSFWPGILLIELTTIRGGKGF